MNSRNYDSRCGKRRCAVTVDVLPSPERTPGLRSIQFHANIVSSDDANQFPHSHGTIASLARPLLGSHSLLILAAELLTEAPAYHQLCWAPSTLCESHPDQTGLPDASH